MSEPFVYVVLIRAPIAKVWEALTTPAMTRKFWFDTEVQEDWRVGARFELNREGELTDFGEVLESNPPQRLVFTFQHATEPMKSEGASRVSYDLFEAEGLTRLILTHDRLAEGGALAKGISRGWPAILSGLKTLLETGEALPPVWSLMDW